MVLHLTHRACPLLGLVAIVAGCNLQPRTMVTSVSPDGRHTARVWRGPSLDPPNDFLYLRSPGTSERTLLALAPDADWCRTIVWTPDSTKVGFVVSDDRLALFDVDSATLEAFFFLAGTGCCGGAQESRSVALSADGREVSFDRVERATVLLGQNDGKTVEATVSRESSPELLATKTLTKPARNIGREVVRVPVSRLRLRLIPPSDSSLPALIFVRVILLDGRWIEVEGRPDKDGLVSLPAVHDGPVDRLEIGMTGLGGRRVVVDDVAHPAEATVVNLPTRGATN
jgi:hypothetical protein